MKVIQKWTAGSRMPAGTWRCSGIISPNLVWYHTTAHFTDEEIQLLRMLQAVCVCVCVCVWVCVCVCVCARACACTLQRFHHSLCLIRKDLVMLRETPSLTEQIKDISLSGKATLSLCDTYSLTQLRLCMNIVLSQAVLWATTYCCWSKPSILSQCQLLSQACFEWLYRCKSQVPSSIWHKSL